MQDSDDLGIAFIGAGDVSLLHARALSEVEGAQLLGLWNRTASRASQRAEEFGCRRYGSVQELLSDADIDAVFVLTNLETHFEYAARALQAGKDVLVEKPVGTSVSEIRDLERIASDCRRLCMPGHNYIYEESLRRTRALIGQGDLGQIVSVYVLYNIHHSEDVARRYPGVIRQILTHHCYILLFLAGPVSTVSAFKASLHYRELDREDLAMVNLELESGALGHFCASFAADDHASDPWTVQIRVIGTAGSARYSYRDWVECKAGTAHSQTYSAYFGSIRNEVDHFVNACIRRGKPPLSSLEDAAQAQRMIEAIEESVAKRCSVDVTR